MHSQATRLKEYGMYIRRARTGRYNLGWSDATKRGSPPGGLATFDTYDDAYRAFEEALEFFWGAYQESLVRDVNQVLSTPTLRK